MHSTSESDIDTFLHSEGRKVAHHTKKTCLIWIPFLWIDKRKASVQEALVSLGGWGPCFRNPLPLLTSERELVSGVRKDLKQVFEKETIKSHLKRERDKRTGYSRKRRFYLKDSWARKKTSHKIHSYRKKTMFWMVTLQDQARIRWDLYFWGHQRSWMDSIHNFYQKAFPQHSGQRDHCQLNFLFHFKCWKSH